MHHSGLTLLLVWVSSVTVVQCGPLCLPCEAGFGVQHECNSTQGTICQPCKPGHFSKVRSFFDPCKPCTKCPLENCEIASCSPKSDTVCHGCETKLEGNKKTSSHYERKSSDKLNRDRKGPQELSSKTDQKSTMNSENEQPKMFISDESLDRSSRSLRGTDLPGYEEELGSGSAAVVVFPDWPASGVDPPNVDESVDLSTTSEGSESMEDMLEKEELLPEHKPGTTPDKATEEAEDGSGSGDTIEVNVEIVYTTRLPDLPKEKRGSPKEENITQAGTALENSKTGVTEAPVLPAPDVREMHNTGGSKLSKAAKTGIIVASVVAGVVIVIIIFFLICRLNRKKKKVPTATLR